MDRVRSSLARLLASCFCSFPFWSFPPSVAAAGPDAGGPLEQAMAAAESRLQARDLMAAEGHFHEALFEGWLLTGTLERTDRQLEAAREAYRKAAPHATQTRQVQSLGAAYLEMGDAVRAVEILTALADRAPDDVQARRSLARALSVLGRVDEALRHLGEAWRAASGDAELSFALAIDYLSLKRVAEAERLFAHLLKERPIAQTHVLVGHAYRDAGEYERARRELRTALDKDPRVRRAHYTLATVILADLSLGPDRRGKAIEEFREELKVSPQDAQTSDRLGLELLEAGQPKEALAFFETATRMDERALYVYHLGRCRLALDEPSEAAALSRRALRLALEQGAGEDEIEKMHYQLGLAARKIGAIPESAKHFAEARRISARFTERRQGEGTPSSASAASLPSAERVELKERVKSLLARAYLNLGVMQVQGAHYERAVELFEQAAEVDPDSPQVQYSLGVARFNAKQFDKATGPLALALAANPNDADLRRTLAMAWLNTQAYDKAAGLLQDDPDRSKDASLQFTYGVALMHSRRIAEAEVIFKGLLAQYGESAELNEALRFVRDQR